VPWRKPTVVEIKKSPAGLAAEYPAPSHPPLPKETWSKASESPPRINYHHPTHVEIDSKPVSVIHIHPQKAWHFSTKPWRLGNAAGAGSETTFLLAGNRNRAPTEKSDRPRDLVSRINETLAPEKHRIFES
jgi:hypothetical protein